MIESSTPILTVSYLSRLWSHGDCDTINIFVADWENIILSMSISAVAARYDKDENSQEHCRHHHRNYSNGIICETNKKEQRKLMFYYVIDVLCQCFSFVFVLDDDCKVVIGSISHS